MQSLSLTDDFLIQNSNPLETDLGELKKWIKRMFQTFVLMKPCKGGDDQKEEKEDVETALKINQRDGPFKGLTFAVSGNFVNITRWKME